MNKSKIKYKLLFTTMLLIGLIFNLILLITYIKAKYNAVKYLQIVTIRDEESYQRVKFEIYGIVSEYIKRTVFKNKSYDGPNYSRIYYKVNSITGYIKGYNHYTFKINWTSNGYHTIDSIIYIKNGVIYNAHRHP